MTQVYFHESTVLKIELDSCRSLILIEDARNSIGEHCFVTIEIDEVSDFLVEGRRHQSYSSPSLDGEVLTLKHSDTQVNLLIEWHNYTTQEHTTQEILIVGRTQLKVRNDM